MARRIEDLPAPLAPISATVSPSADLERHALQRIDVIVVEFNIVKFEQRIHGLQSDRFIFSAQIGLDDLGVLLDFRRRTLGDLLPEVQDDDPVRNVHHGRHVMLDKQNGDAAVPDLSDDLDRPPGFVMVHPGEGFVEKQDRRVRRQTNCDAERPQMAVRQVAGDLVAQVAETQKLENLVSRPTERFLVLARCRGPEIEARKACLRSQMMRR